MQQGNFESAHLTCLKATTSRDLHKADLDKKVESSIQNTKISPLPEPVQEERAKFIKQLSSGSRLSRSYCIGSEIRISTEVTKKESTRPALRNIIDRKTGKSKILKIISKHRIPAGVNGMKTWTTLCERLLNLRTHPNLMSIYEIYESESSFYIIAEKLEGGELFDFLLKEKAIPEDICKYIIRQVLLATEYLHSNNLLHRDIKPENLMFRRNINSRSLSVEDRYELALIDFDTCKITNLPSSQECEIVNGRRRLVGTYGYLAPEVLKGYDYSPASDLWSIGVVLYILMTGVPPSSMDLMYDAQSSLNVLRHAEANGLDFDMPPFLDFPLARDLCKRLLTFDPKKRLSSAALALEHPWLANIPPCFIRSHDSDNDGSNGNGSNGQGNQGGSGGAERNFFQNGQFNLPKSPFYSNGSHFTGGNAHFNGFNGAGSPYNGFLKGWSGSPIGRVISNRKFQLSQNNKRSPDLPNDKGSPSPACTVVVEDKHSKYIPFNNNDIFDLKGNMFPTKPKVMASVFSKVQSPCNNNGVIQKSKRIRKGSIENRCSHQQTIVS